MLAWTIFILRNLRWTNSGAKRTLMRSWHRERNGSRDRPRPWATGKSPRHSIISHLRNLRLLFFRAHRTKVELQNSTTPTQALPLPQTLSTPFNANRFTFPAMSSTSIPPNNSTIALRRLLAPHPRLTSQRLLMSILQAWVEQTLRMTPPHRRSLVPSRWATSHSSPRITTRRFSRSLSLQPTI